MALVLNNSNNLKYKTLTGVYQGQKTPLRIGTLAFDQRPNHIGIYRGDDSVTMNAFFDPVASPKVDRLYRSQALPNPFEIAYVQVGQFSINNKPLPVLLHQSGNIYPHTTDLHDTNPHPYTWVDICEKNDANITVIYPYYPNWRIKDEPDYPYDQLFRHPQEFGGFLKIPMNNPAPGDYLCAFMSSDADLGNGSIQSVDVKVALDNTPLNTFNGISTGIRLEELPYSWVSANPGTDLAVVSMHTIERLRRAGGPVLRVVPPLLIAAPPTQRPPTAWLSLEMKRLYIQYVSQVRERGGRVIESLQIIVLYEDPQSRGTVACAQISDFVALLKEEISNDSVDFSRLASSISWATERAVTAEGSSKKVRSTMALDQQPMVISYRYIVYPCTIRIQNGSPVTIFLYEGFSWQASRTYLPDDGWEESASPVRVDLCSEYDEWLFKNELVKYYQKISGHNSDIHVQFPIV